MRNNFRIIDIVQIQYSQKLYVEWDDFIISSASDFDLIIDIKSNFLYQYNLEVFSSQSHPLVLRSENALVSANEDWSKVDITLLEGKTNGLEGALSASIMSYLSTRNAIMIHSSLIDVNGKGIMFVGPSNIGKTTQAELWNQYRDAVIINGDMAFVNFDGKEYWGYGCPWHGSSPYCENRNVKLCGIIVLEKALENEIVCLRGISMIERIMGNVFLPKWYEKGVHSSLHMLDGLLSNVPVYLLRCRKDVGAIEMVERVLFKEND